jgi:hypothetical protein
MSSNTVRRQFFYFFSLFLFLISCRKSDYKQVETKVDQSVRFFALPGNIDPAIKKVAIKFQQENDKYHFLERFISEQGFPIWSKAIVKVPQKKKTGGRDALEATDTTIIIPLVLESTFYVNSFIVARLTDSIDAVIFRGDLYSSLPFSCISSQFTAEKYAREFMLLNNWVFGYTEFKLTDDELYNCVIPVQSNTQFRTAKIKLEGTYDAKGLYFSSESVTICYSINHCPYPGNCNGPRGTCDRCITICESQFCFDYEVDTWYFGGGNGGPKGDPTGGGGGGNGCKTYGSFGVSGCGGSGPLGWDPVPVIKDPNPCAFLTSLLATQDFKFVLSDLRNSVSQNHESGYLFKDPLATPPAYEGPISGPDGNLSIDINPAVPIDGVAHNHNNDPARLPIYSLDDLRLLYTWTKNKKLRDFTTFSFTLVTDNTAYVIMIEDLAMFKLFGQTWFDNSGKNKLLKLTYDKGYNIVENTPGLSPQGLTTENETREKSFLKFVSMFDLGLKLFKGNTSMTIFSPIKYDKATDKVVPNPCND